LLEQDAGMKIRPGLLALLLLCPFFTAHAANLSKQVLGDEGFVLRFPDDWFILPRPMLDELLQAQTQAQPAKKHPKRIYGCQRFDPQERGRRPPSILVASNEGGRLPLAQHKEDAVDASSKRPHLFSAVNIAEPVYDEKAHILWVTSTAVLPDGKEASVLEARILTQLGYVEVISVASKMEFARYEPLFNAIAQAVQLDEELRYQPHWSDKLSESPSGMEFKGLKGSDVVVALILLGSVLLFFQRSKT